MSRVEENKQIINYVSDIAEQKREGTFEEIVTVQLGGIMNFIGDISKSLAVIADKTKGDI